MASWDMNEEGPSAKGNWGSRDQGLRWKGLSQHKKNISPKEPSEKVGSFYLFSGLLSCTSFLPELHWRVKLSARYNLSCMDPL